MHSARDPEDNLYPFPNRNDPPVPICQKIAQRDIAHEEEAKAAGVPSIEAMRHDGLGADQVPDLDGEVTELAAEVTAIQSRLAYLSGAVDGRSLAGSLVGLVGNSAEEMRRQIRPLRQALKDEGGGAAA